MVSLRDPDRRGRAGFTLVEMVLSLTLMTILLGGMASAILVASHALPDVGGPDGSFTAAARAMDMITADLAVATEIRAAKPRRATYDVTDRGHGAAGPESFTYKWSGTPGDPLTLRYNGSSAVTVCADVYDFALTWTTETRPLPGPPRVVLIIANAEAPGPQDLARQALMESWGFTVQLCDDYASAATVEALLADADVAYLSATIQYGDLDAAYENFPIGIVNEDHRLCDDVGIADSAYATVDDEEIWISDNSHELTSGFGIGPLQIFNASKRLAHTSPAIAPGGQVLGQWPGYDPTIVVLESGAERSDGDPAAGRRVKLPWGAQGLDPGLLTSAGLQLMEEAITWAATPVVTTRVQIALQVGANPAGRIETQVELLNMPAGAP